MGIERSHSPDYFRKRAEEFRAKAHDCQAGRTKDALLEAAKQYEQLARRAEVIRTVQELRGLAESYDLGVTVRKVSQS